MKPPRQRDFYIEVRGGDGKIRVSVPATELTTLGSIALKMAGQCAALLANQSAEVPKYADEESRRFLCGGDTSAPKEAGRG